MDDFANIVDEFLVESHESLDELERNLFELVDAPGDPSRLASIFRAVHTIKGTAGFLAFPKLQRVSHVSENLLVPLRDGELNLSPEIAAGLLAVVDAIRDILAQVESSGGEGDADYEVLIARLESLRWSGDAAPGQLTTVSSEPFCTLPQTNVARLDSIAGVVSTDTAAPTTASKVEHPITVRRERLRPVAESTIRIDVDLLDKLMNLVGELVLTRNQIRRFCELSDTTSMVSASQRLNLITTELQESVIRTRMQPISNVWNKLPRVVRDLATACGKKIQVQMEGAETELDKTILEAIRDPLTHIVRNSVDHGIELAETRAANGKPPEGTICLRAYHENGQVNIEVIDDGGGINVKRVQQKAVDSGLVTQEQAASMTAKEIVNLILLPGFSTAECVTDISGRGVGMDVVKTNVERIGGSIEVDSVLGQGTTLHIKIPLTLAIIPALIVRAGSGKYAIPQASLRELIRLNGALGDQEVEYVCNAPVFRLRGNLLPLVCLDEVLELCPRRTRFDPTEITYIVVLQVDGRTFGLVVDSVTDTQEIVVKPLGRFIAGLGTYSGSTIMGDGSLALILDVAGIAQKNSILSERRNQSFAGISKRAETASAKAQDSLLIVDGGDGSCVAMKLSTVARLVEFDVSQIERTRHADVLQYRDRIVPIVWFNGHDLRRSIEADKQRISVVLFESGPCLIGLVVARVIDIVQRSQVDRDTDTLPGHFVVQGRVAQLVDIEEYLRTACPGAFELSSQSAADSMATLQLV